MDLKDETITDLERQLIMSRDSINVIMKLELKLEEKDSWLLELDSFILSLKQAYNNLEISSKQQLKTISGLQLQSMKLQESEMKLKEQVKSLTEELKIARDKIVVLNEQMQQMKGGDMEYNT